MIDIDRRTVLIVLIALALLSAVPLVVSAAETVLLTEDNTYSTSLEGVEGVAYDETNEIAYVASDNIDRVTAIDVSGGSHSIIGYIRGSNLNDVQDVALGPNNDYLYAVGPKADTLVVIDVTDPSNPTEAATLTNSMDGPRELVVDGADDRLFVSQTSDNLTVVDITDPTNPTVSGDESASVNGHLAYDSDSVFIGDRSGATVEVVDVTDSANPTVGSSTSAFSGSVTGIEHDSNRDELLVSTDDGKLARIDVSDRSNPTVSANESISSYADGIGIEEDTTTAYVGTGSIKAVDYSDSSLPVIDETGSFAPEDVTFGKSGDIRRVLITHNSYELTTLRAFAPQEPQFDNSIASPSGGELVTTPDPTIEINVTDFEDDKPGEATVTFKDASDDSTIGTDTLSDNGTASTTWDDLTIGNNEWYAVVEDEYGGETDTSDTFSFETEREIRVYNETNPDTLVDTSGEATVTFFGDDEVYTRDLSDGTLDMSGLPLEQFVIQIEVDGYVTRRAVIESIITQNDVFVLPESADSSEIAFRLDDQTGRFPDSETILFIEKPITRDGSTENMVITADEFGASGDFATELERDQRYRLRVRNQDNETRVLGSYTVTESATVTLPIGGVQISGEVDEESEFDVNLRNADDPANAELRIAYVDPTETTDELRISAETKNGTTVRNETVETGPYGAYQETLPLANWSGEDAIIVSVEADRGGETQEFEQTVGRLPNLSGDIAIDDDVLELMGNVSVVMIMGLLVIINPPLAALVGVLWAAMLAATGFISISGVAISVAGSVAILFVVGSGGGGRL